MKKSELLKQGNYLTVIKPLAHKIGLEETIILMELVGMEEYKEQKHQLFKELMDGQNKKINKNKLAFYEDDRAFECTATELELATTIKRKKQIGIIKKLSDLQLLTAEQRGLPAKRFIKLHHANIEKILDEAVTSYQEFKDQFFAEKKESLQEQMKKRKENKYKKSLLSQKGTTDNDESYEDENSKKTDNIQLSQKRTTSNPKLGQQVESNEDSLNNNQSLKISNVNNKKDLSIYEEKITNSRFAKPIQIVLMNKIDRLINDNISLDFLESIWEAEKNSATGLNEYHFAIMLETALTHAKKPIGKVDNFFLTALTNYKEKRVKSAINKNEKPVRTEKIPEYMTESDEPKKEKTIEELEELLVKLKSIQKKERFTNNNSILLQIKETEAKLEQMKKEKKELEELLKPYINKN